MTFEGCFFFQNCHHLLPAISAHFLEQSMKVGNQVLTYRFCITFVLIEYGDFVDASSNVTNIDAHLL